MSTIEERSEYLNNPYFKKHIYGDFTPFYITIGICTVFVVVLIILNFIFGCCSKYKEYWQNPHTGNRFLVSLWSSTPHKQPPLDLELVLPPPNKFVEVEYPRIFRNEEQEYQQEYQPVQYSKPPKSFFSRGEKQEEFVELHKRESDI